MPAAAQQRYAGHGCRYLIDYVTFTVPQRTAECSHRWWQSRGHEVGDGTQSGSPTLGAGAALYCGSCGRASRCARDRSKAYPIGGLLSMRLKYSADVFASYTPLGRPRVGARPLRAVVMLI